jgi:hypothetical protein
VHVVYRLGWEGKKRHTAVRPAGAKEESIDGHSRRPLMAVHSV